MTTRIGSGRAIALLLMLTTAPAPLAAQERALCVPLGEIIAAAPREFRVLRGEEYSTKFESWRARVTLPGFDACWIDDVSRSFWCLLQAPDMAAAGAQAERMRADVDACHAQAARGQSVEVMENNVTRAITEWSLTADRRARVVHRYPTRPPGLAAVFFYVY